MPLHIAGGEGDARAGEQDNRVTQLDEASADLANGGPVIPAEVGDSLVLRNQAVGEPHDIHAASRLALEPAARLHTVQVTVDIELQQNRRVIGRLPRRSTTDPLEAQVAEIEFFHEDIDHLSRIIFRHEIVRALRYQARLVPRNALDKALHGRPQFIVAAGFYHNRVITQLGSGADGPAGQSFGL